MRAVNLIPGDQRSVVAIGTGRSQGGAYAVIALLAGLAVLAYMYGHARHQISSLSARSAAISSQVQQIDSETAQLAPYASFGALREQRVDAVSELVDARFDWSHEFHELGRVLPSSVWFTSIAGSIGGATTTGTTATSSGSAATSGGTTAVSPVTSSTPAGSVPTFSLTGCATNQADVAVALDRLRLIDGVSAVTLETSTEAPASSTSAGCRTEFSANLTFEPLPSPSAITAATAPATRAGTSTVAATSTAGGAQ